MLNFHPYGLMISLAMVAGLLVGWLRRKRYGLETSDLEDLFLLIAPLAILGARAYHVLDKWSYYRENLGQIIAVWNGGLGIFGGVAGGLVGVWIFTKIKNYPPVGGLKIMNYLDFLMPSLAIGQAIGRWGNFFNHEVFGPPAGGLPWKWYIPENLRPEFWKNYSYFHPTFAYESLWAMVGFILLIYLELSLRDPAKRGRGNLIKEKIASSVASRLPRNDKIDLTPSPTNFTLKPGFLTGFYCLWYGTGRFFFEFLRFDTASIFGIKTAQIISLFLVGFGLWLVQKSKKIE